VCTEFWHPTREARARLAPYEQLARIVIRRRMELGLTQEQLAERMGTSHSAISRIESGQHSTSVQTLQRLADALEMRFVMGFEHGPADKPVRELVRCVAAPTIRRDSVWLNECETLTDARRGIGGYVDSYHHRPDLGLDYPPLDEVRRTWEDQQQLQRHAAQPCQLRRGAGANRWRASRQSARLVANRERGI
jgi:transcriptional regulator with XRE-family HTH domain